jgi:hypothetical protein
METEEDRLFYLRQVSCNHQKQPQYTQRRFDILNGLEFTFTRCNNCHKIVGLQAKKFAKH